MEEKGSRITDATNNGGQYRTTEGADLAATGDTGGGHAIGWFNAGELMKYTVNVTRPAPIRLVPVTTPNAGKTVRIEIDGTDVTGNLTVPPGHSIR